MVSELGAARSLEDLQNDLERLHIRLARVETKLELKLDDSSVLNASPVSEEAHGMEISRRFQNRFEDLGDWRDWRGFVVQLIGSDSQTTLQSQVAVVFCLDVFMFETPGRINWNWKWR